MTTLLRLILCAVMLAVVQAVHASVVQITLSGNRIDSLAGNNLDADVTGDAVPDITLSGASANPANPWSADVTIDGIIFQTFGGSVAGSGGYFINGGALGSGSGNPSAYAIYYLPITFNDAGYSASPVDAAVEIRVQGHETDAGQSGVFLQRVIFDVNLHGIPAGLNEYWIVPEAQRIPEPASAAMLMTLAGLILLGAKQHRTQ